MSTWQGATRRIAIALADLAAPARDPSATVRSQDIDLDVALTARAAVLAGVSVVVHDLAPAGRITAERAATDPTDAERLATERPAAARTAGRATSSRGGTGRGAFARDRDDLLALTDRDPVRALGLLLSARGRPELGRRPSELLDAATPGSRPTLRWAAAGRHALLADRIWTAAPRHLNGAHAWEVIGEAAALAELIAILDPDLIRLAALVGRPEVPSYLDRTAGLRLLAREVRTLAVDPTDNALPATGTHAAIRAREPLSAIAPTDGVSAIRATRRLTMLIRCADTLTPDQVRVLATVGRDLAVLAAANGATGPGGMDLRRELGEVAIGLNHVVTGRHGEAATVEERQPGLEHQIRRLARYTRDAFAGRAPRPQPADATRLAACLPDLVATLADQANAQVAQRRWALPDRNDRPRLYFAVATTADPHRTPRMTIALNNAAEAADVLRLHTAERRAPVSSLAPATVTLEMQLHSAMRRPTARHRPEHPAAPLHERLPPSA